ncbi:MAG: outer membrane protein assembly factor BamA [Deltaproteobacteria bacterium]|nr:MAG: outer membrane protein assembly factor BamA [Deltaproteobacteria bacterium]
MVCWLRSKNRVIFILFFSFVLFYLKPAYSQCNIVEDVQVQGNHRIEKEAILAVIRTRPGSRLDYETLDKDLRDIYRMGYFSDVKIEVKDGKRGKIVIFIVKEKPVIAKIIFEGNKKLKEDKLKKEIGIRLYSMLDYNALRQSINKLKEFYAAHGYYKAQISYEVIPMPRNQVAIRYKIKEGKKVYIKKIEIIGNKKISDKQIKKVMITKEKGLISWFKGTAFLDKKRLEYDVNKITIFYHNHGFIEAKVSDPKIRYDKKLDGFVVTFEVYEGPQYHVNRVSITGDLVRPADEIMKVIKLKKGDVFNREQVRKDIESIKKLYADEGYAFAEVIPLSKKDTEKHLVDLIYKISKGPKVRIERINIEGNTITRDKVIRRELKLAEGDYFSGKKLQDSIDNLNRLGFFKDVKIEKRRGSAPDKMILDVKVKEAPTGSFSFGAGFSTMDRLMGSIELSRDNFRGLGERIGIALRFGGVTSLFDIDYYKPWMFDKPISGEFRAFRWRRDFDEYSRKSVGGSISLGFPLKRIDEYTRGWIEYEFDSAKIYDVYPYSSYVIRAMEGTFTTSGISFGINRISVDNIRYPTRGSLNRFSFEYVGGILGGDNAYNKYLAQSTWFFKLKWDTVIMLQGRWGRLQKRSGGMLPVYEKFFIGGIDTVRGFNYQEISPRDPITLEKIGGEKMMIYNVEYRVPVTKDKSFIALAFFDTGNVWRASEDYSFSDMRRSIGFGIRWYSPMGPIRIEWGFALNKKPYETGSKLHFSMGSKF